MALLICLFAALCGVCFAYDLYVNSEANENGADGSEEHPYINIQDAINHAFDDTLPINLPSPSVVINVYTNASGYQENLNLNYMGSNGPHLVSDIIIQSTNNDPEDCAIIAYDSSDPVITLKGTTSSLFKLQGFEIKHSAMVNGVVNRGIFLTLPSGNYGYFNILDINNCIFDNNHLSLEIDSHMFTVNQLKVINSTFSITQHYTSQSYGIKADFAGHGSNVYISGNEFIRNNPNTLESTSVALGSGVANIELYDNLFDNTHIGSTGAGVGYFIHQDVVIRNNRFQDAGIYLARAFGNWLIEQNKFVGLSSAGDRSAITLRGGISSSSYLCSINENTFYNCFQPLEIKFEGNLYLSEYIIAVLSNNSFINCGGVLTLQRLSNMQAASNSVSLYRDNLYYGTSNAPFIVIDEDDNPLVLMGDNRIPVSYSHFSTTLTPTQTSSLILDNTSVSYGNPYITIDESTHSYTLNWDEVIRSPLIMTGYGGIVSPSRYDRLDIGAVQYDEQAHEFINYSFPAYSDRNGLKWMSYPTLDRIWNPATNDPDVAGVFFNPIMNNMVLHDITWKVKDDPQQDIHYSEQLLDWVGDQSHNITPQQGYKIQMAQGLQTPVNIDFPGIIPDVSQYPITIKALPAAKNDPYNQYNDNWLGYFHAETANAEDAFASIIDDLWYIQTQNWTMVREKVMPGSPWIYAMQTGQKPTLSYGDMVIIKCFNDAQFTWNTGADNQIPVEKELTSHYIYTEKADYVPFYVELDADDLPSEVALYVDDVCKGATVVCDSLVEIPGYILDGTDPNAEVEILAYYENKAAVDKVQSYRVWNPGSGAYDNKPLKLNSTDHYYKLKLDKGSDEVPAISEPAISIYPNPFNPSTTIKFGLAEPSDIKLEIYNQKGQLVKCLAQGRADSGWSSIIWNGTDSHNRKVASGLYYSKLSYDGKSITKKMVLMK